MSDTITLPREVVELALEALDYGGFLKKQQSITALRTALAAEPPKQEPVRCNPAAMRTTASSPAVLFITELDPPALAAPRPEPSGYAYRYNDGVLRFNGGSTINGAPPIEVLPYWFAPPTAAPSEDIDALRQELAAVLSDWNSLVRASGSRTNGGAVGHVAALRRDAERYRWGVENARWIRHEHEAYVAIPVAVDADLSCTPMRTAAIDAAMKGDKT
jgi:hypothetical protein